MSELALEKAELVNWFVLHRAGCVCAAASTAQLGAIELLLARGAVIDSTYSDGQTPLMVAAASSRLEAVNFPIARGAKLDLTDEKEDSALDLANGPQKKQVVALLKKAGAKETVPNLFRAVKRKDTVLLRSLLDQGADPNARDALGETVISLAKKDRDVDAIEALHSVGVKKPAAAPIPRTMGEAAERDDLAGIKQLINKGANPNVADKTGYTPLVLLLAQRGKQINLMDMIYPNIFRTLLDTY
jgi:ankyrin repeat protein